LEDPLEKKILNGNEALALGALRAGVKVITGYPGTPSTRALASLLAMNLPDRHVEWSTNEKVALEIATGASWAGQRALCTMKMSGLNVAYDSLISIAHSGCIGGLVIYVADDPGVSAGMAEQDSRGFAYMSDLPMLDPASPAEAYRQVQEAFELSEQIGSPVFIRMVTAIANSKTLVEVEEAGPALVREPVLVNDIQRFTKAGSAIAMGQHREVIARLKRARRIIQERGLNPLALSAQAGGLGIIASGVVSSYLDECLDLLVPHGFLPDEVSILKVAAVNPIPVEEIQALLMHVDTILVLEELEPYLEKEVYVQAYRSGVHHRIIGKLDSFFSRVGEYGVREVTQGIAEGLGLSIPLELFEGRAAETLAAARPITLCAGCPHRGTFMAINQALRKLRYKKNDVMVTGDIGCTILGMNPPFSTVWNEISMGASVALAQGFVHAGVKTPVIATIGDSTFFHAGIPGLINAIQHQVDLTLIIMDNGWTAMTGMQVNPGTASDFQKPHDQSVDIARVVPGLGVEHFFTVDPFDYKGSTAVIQQALGKPGVKVILARRECAIQTQRRGETQAKAVVDMQKCALCKLCINLTGCPALSIQDGAFLIDLSLCNGCGLCVETCNLDALRVEVLA